MAGADQLLGTNPIVVGVPTNKEYPMVLDMSTSVAAFGKNTAYRREGKENARGLGE
jgi:LDH2 family malate/lactate/ureidoglycolate dehydrogenase